MTDNDLHELKEILKGVDIQDALRYANERLDLINKIKLQSEPLSIEQREMLESKTISELMRIYYGGIKKTCMQCGKESAIVHLDTIYRNNAS